MVIALIECSNLVVEFVGEGGSDDPRRDVCRERVRGVMDVARKGAAEIRLCLFGSLLDDPLKFSLTEEFGNENG